MPRRKGDKGPNQIRQLGGERFTDEEVIRAALEATCGNVTRAALSVGLERTAFWYHLWRLGLGHVPGEIRERVRRRFLDED